MTRLVLTSLRLMKHLNVLCGLALTLLWGCTAQPPPITISLAPQVIVPKIDLGGGRNVYLSVVDDRPNNRILEYPEFYSARQSQTILITSQPIAVVLENSVGQGLKSMGFELIPTLSSSDTQLKINVLSFYVVRIPTGFFDGNWVGKLGVKVQLYKNERQVLDKEYNSLNDVSKPSPNALFLATSITPFINPIVSDLILRILGDLELIAALQSPEG